MALTPEQTQQALDVQSRMLNNIQMGKPPHEGIAKEDLQLAVANMRAGRATMAAAAATGRKKATARKNAVSMDELEAKLGIAGLEDAPPEPKKGSTMAALLLAEPD